jgi:hypothetical protein
MTDPVSFGGLGALRDDALEMQTLRLRLAIERAERAEDEVEQLLWLIGVWKAARSAAVSDVSPGTFSELADAETALVGIETAEISKAKVESD